MGGEARCLEDVHLIAHLIAHFVEKWNVNFDYRKAESFNRRNLGVSTAEYAKYAKRNQNTPVRRTYPRLTLRAVHRKSMDCGRVFIG